MLFCEVLKLGNAVCQNKKCSMRKKRLSQDIREDMAFFYLLPKTIPVKISKHQANRGQVPI